MITICYWQLRCVRRTQGATDYSKIASTEAWRPAGCCVSVSTRLSSKTGPRTACCSKSEGEEHAVWLQFVWNHTVHWGTVPQGCCTPSTVELPSKIVFSSKSDTKKGVWDWSLVATELSHWLMYDTKFLSHFVSPVKDLKFAVNSTIN